MTQPDAPQSTESGLASRSIETLTVEELADLISDACENTSPPSESLHPSTNPIYAKGRKPNTYFEKITLARRTIVADLYQQGLTSREIAERVNKWYKRIGQGERKITEEVIRKDTHLIRDKWREQQSKTIEEIVIIEMVKLQERESQALDAFLSSQQDKVTITKEEGEGEGAKNTTKISRVGQAGDPALLALALRCMEMRGKILGYMKSADQRVTLTDAYGKPVTPATTQDMASLQRTIEELKNASPEDLQAIVTAGNALKRIDSRSPIQESDSNDHTTI